MLLYAWVFWEQFTEAGKVLLIAGLKNSQGCSWSWIDTNWIGHVIWEVWEEQEAFDIWEEQEGKDGVRLVIRLLRVYEKLN
jgi:hypothetical protein